MGKKAMYGYTIADDVDPNLADQSGDKFDKGPNAQLVTTPFADRKAMRYLGKYDFAKEEPNMDVTGAGAGRGKQGGPTAKELAAYERKQNEGIYTAEKGRPPMDPEGAKKRGGVIKKMASGGMTSKVSSASKRADGIATKGKTRGTMITMCGGGMYKRK